MSLFSASILYYQDHLFRATLANLQHVPLDTRWACTPRRIQVMDILEEMEFTYIIQPLHKGLAWHAVHCTLNLLWAIIIHNNWDRSRSDSFDIVMQTNILMHVIIVIIGAMAMTYTTRALEGQTKIVLDISGLGGAPKVSIIHLVRVIHQPTIHTWNSKWYKEQHKQNVIIERHGLILGIMDVYVMDAK